MSPTKDQLRNFYEAMIKGEVVKVDSFLREYPDVVHQRFDSRPLIEECHQKMHPHHVAVIHNQPAVLVLLLAYKPDLESLDIKGQTALHYAVECGSKRINRTDYIEVMETLLKGGADVEGRSSKHWSPLGKATNPVWVEGATLLLKYGADPTRKIWMDMTPLMRLQSAAHHNPELAKALDAAAMRFVGGEVSKGTIEKVRIVPKIKLKPRKPF